MTKNEKLLKIIATRVIKNMIRSRSVLQYELGAALVGPEKDRREDLDEILEAESLIRGKLPTSDIIKAKKILQKYLPDVRWNVENISDALFINHTDVFEAFLQNGNKE